MHVLHCEFVTNAAVGTSFSLVFVVSLEHLALHLSRKYTNDKQLFESF